MPVSNNSTTTYSGSTGQSTASWAKSSVVNPFAPKPSPFYQTISNLTGKPYTPPRGGGGSSSGGTTYYPQSPAGGGGGGGGSSSGSSSASSTKPVEEKKVVVEKKEPEVVKDPFFKQATIQPNYLLIGQEKFGGSGTGMQTGSYWIDQSNLTSKFVTEKESFKKDQSLGYFLSLQAQALSKKQEKQASKIEELQSKQEKELSKLQSYATDETGAIIVESQEDLDKVNKILSNVKGLQKSKETAYYGFKYLESEKQGKVKGVETIAKSSEEQLYDLKVLGSYISERGIERDFDSSITFKPNKPLTTWEYLSGEGRKTASKTVLDVVYTPGEFVAGLTADALEVTGLRKYSSEERKKELVKESGRLGTDVGITAGSLFLGGVGGIALAGKSTLDIGASEDPLSQENLLSFGTGVALGGGLTVLGKVGSTAVKAGKLGKLVKSSATASKAISLAGKYALPVGFVGLSAYSYYPSAEALSKGDVETAKELREKTNVTFGTFVLGGLAGSKIADVGLKALAPKPVSYKIKEYSQTEVYPIEGSDYGYFKEGRLGRKKTVFEITYKKPLTGKTFVKKFNLGNVGKSGFYRSTGSTALESKLKGSAESFFGVSDDVGTSIYELKGGKGVKGVNVSEEFAKLKGKKWTISDVASSGLVSKKGNIETYSGLFEVKSPSVKVPEKGVLVGTRVSKGVVYKTGGKPLLFDSIDNFLYGVKPGKIQVEKLELFKVDKSGLSAVSKKADISGFAKVYPKSGVNKPFTISDKMLSDSLVKQSGGLVLKSETVVLPKTDVGSSVSKAFGIIEKVVTKTPTKAYFSPPFSSFGKSKTGQVQVYDVEYSNVVLPASEQAYVNTIVDKVSFDKVITPSVSIITPVKELKSKAVTFSASSSPLKTMDLSKQEPVFKTPKTTGVNLVEKQVQSQKQSQDSLIGLSSSLFSLSKLSPVSLTASKTSTSTVGKTGTSFIPITLPNVIPGTHKTIPPFSGLDFKFGGIGSVMPVEKRKKVKRAESVLEIKSSPIGRLLYGESSVKASAKTLKQYKSYYEGSGVLGSFPTAEEYKKAYKSAKKRRSSKKYGTVENLFKKYSKSEKRVKKKKK